MPKKRRQFVHPLRQFRPSYPTLEAYFLYSGDSQANASRLTDTTQAQMSRFKDGIAIPRPALAARLAEYANIPLDSFQRVYLAKQMRGELPPPRRRQRPPTVVPPPHAHDGDVT